VSDTGIGLMPQEQTRLFTKFYRAGNHMTDGVEGTGLGLVVAKSIVEQYGGKVWVQSKWQEGSTFSFSLPRSRAG
jgi:signal transduction histidine kinase